MSREGEVASWLKVAVMMKMMIAGCSNEKADDCRLEY